MRFIRYAGGGSVFGCEHCLYDYVGRNAQDADLAQRYCWRCGRNRWGQTRETTGEGLLPVDAAMAGAPMPEYERIDTPEPEVLGSRGGTFGGGGASANWGSDIASDAGGGSDSGGSSGSGD